MRKPTKWQVRPAKTQISLGIRTVWSECPGWSESSLSTWRKLGSLATIERTAKTLIRLGGCPDRSESSMGAHVILLVLSWGGSIVKGIETKYVWSYASLEIPGQAHAEQLYVNFWRRDVKTKCYRFVGPYSFFNNFTVTSNTLLLAGHPLWKYTARWYS